ncbi:NUDIX domain-containing protein [Nocardioides sp. zg-DK7169]|uniref:NUDIX domain-containing protein n=1 Tax=Nocardioides sp. zg-DK7169 TaxID=2736600 RepID=UPI0020A65D30|nr:NUDIX domain-containing protein [Nocardioides sp. zg-DK7169]
MHTVPSSAQSTASVAPDPGERRLLLAVDAPSLLHRNHHARAHTDMRDRHGRPAWALHGMLRQILEAIDLFAPDALIFGLDDRVTSQRERFYPSYKAGRAAKDATLVDQLDRAGALLDAMGFLTLTPPGLEADDVNASAAAWAVAHDWRCVLITSDRDSFAHISEHTEVLRLINGGISASPLLNPRRLKALYGVEAHHYLDFAALRGDASDNLPGVPGIGEKTAPLLLSQMGSMQAVWADIDHCGGANLVATLDSYCEEHGLRRVGATLLKRLSAPGARERYHFNLAIMSGRTDLDLGLTPDVPGSRGLLPLDHDRVARVVDFLGVGSTTALALRVLTEPPAAAPAHAPAPPAGQERIVVAGVCVRDERGHLLVVRKATSRLFQLPGGKLEPGESPLAAGIRETREEVGLELTDVRELGRFEAPAANEPGAIVESTIYTASSTDTPVAAAEIAEARWIDPAAAEVPLAPLLELHVLPALLADVSR